MGAQWFGMGRAMLKLQPFEESIHESAKALQLLGIDLLKLLLEDIDLNLNEAKDFADITEVFVSLVAIQARITVNSENAKTSEN